MTEEVDSPPRRTRAPRARNGSRGEFRATARDRLIESRLTPNAISLTGFVLNLVAAALILEEHFVLAAFAFIIGSVMDMFDGRYSRMSGKGTVFGAFLDSTLDRIEEGVVLAAVAAYYAKQRRGPDRGRHRARRGGLVHGELHPRPGRGPGCGMQGGHRLAGRPRGDSLRRADVCRRRSSWETWICSSRPCTHSRR